MKPMNIINRTQKQTLFHILLRLKKYSIQIRVKNGENKGRSLIVK